MTSLPFAQIEDNRLTMRFSSADYSIASVLTAVREHMDMLREMGVIFLGGETEVPPGPSPVFKPVSIKIIFEYEGGGEAEKFLRRSYEIIWEGIVNTFPTEERWSESKKAFADFVRAQAELLRARSAVQDK